MLSKRLLFTLVLALLTALPVSVEAVAVQDNATTENEAAADTQEGGEDAAAEEEKEPVIPDVTEMNIEELGGLGAEWLEKGRTWIVEEGPGYAVKILLFLVILLVFGVLSRIAGRIVKKSLELSKLKTPDLLKTFFINVTTKLIMLAGLLIAAQFVGIPIAPLLAGVGVLGFVVGFALQDTLGNFAAGIMLLLYRPYDVGDVVTAAGVNGKVNSMSLVSTTLLTPDNQVEVIPNGKIWGDVITNVTANPTRRIDLVMGIGYDDDIDKAEKVMKEVVTSHPKVLNEPAPAIALSNLGESSVDFVVRPWCKTSDYWGVRTDLLKALKQRFDKEKIAIPYPQRDIHIISGEVPGA